MTQDIDKLEQAAREATPGPWRVSDFEPLSGGENRVLMGDDNYMIGYISGRSEPEHDRDARFIALANPQAILSLIEAYRAAGTYTEAHERLDDLARERVAEAEASLATLKREVVEALRAAEAKLWIMSDATGSSEVLAVHAHVCRTLALLSGGMEGGSALAESAASVASDLTATETQSQPEGGEP